MILEVDFKNHNQEQKTFSFLLHDRRYVYAWKDLNLEWISNRPTQKPEYSAKWFLSSTEQDFVDKLEEIKLHVEKIDELGVTTIGSDKINPNITREELNRLHEEFHKLVEIYPDRDPNSPEGITAQLCHRLNDLVHLTEIAWKNKDEANPDKRVIATAKEHMHVPYEVEDYEFFTTTPIRGALYMGYATPGKNLYHCYCDRDISVIQNKLVRQSQGISCEIHIEITGKESINKWDERYIQADFYEWCEENKVKEYGYDYKLPIYNPGKLEIGHMVEDVGLFEEFLNNKPADILNLRFK